MRIMKAVVFVFFILTFCRVTNAQADCAYDFILFVRDANGNAIKNAHIEMKGNAYFEMRDDDFRYRSQTEMYTAWSLLGEGTKDKVVLEVKAEGFDKFEKQIELRCGFYAYDLRLKSEKQKGLALFKELASLYGKVIDKNNIAIPNAKVILTNKNGKVAETITNENGYYNFISPREKYSLEFVGPNRFKPKKYKDFQLSKGNRNLNVILEVSPCDDCELVVSDKEETSKNP